MNPAMSISNQVTAAAERSAAGQNACEDENAAQVRFSDVLRDQRAQSAKSGSDADREAGDAAVPATEEPAASGAAGDASATGTSAPDSPPGAISIAGLVIDPARLPLARPPAATAAGLAAEAGKAGRPASALTGEPAGDAARLQRGGAGANDGDAALLPFPGAVPGIASTLAQPAGAGRADTAAAAAGRMDARGGPAGLAAALQAGQSAGNGAASALPAGAAARAESAVVAVSAAADATRLEPAAWAAFAVPVDAAAARAPAPPAVVSIEAQVGTPRFADETAQQVSWMTRNGITEAEIRVRPADLGPISVRIEMNQNEATISFAVTQPETRAAVQDSLHRLTEMLAESGISLGGANVGSGHLAQQPRDDTRSQRGQGGSNTGSGGGRLDAIGPVVRPGAERSRGLVDTFA